MRFSKQRNVTIAAGPAIPTNDGVDPSASAANALLADARTNTVPRERVGGEMATLGVIFTPRIRQADGTLRSGGTATYTLWERDDATGDYWMVQGSTVYTEGTTQPVRLTTVGPGCRLFARFTAIGGGVAETDVISCYAGAN